MRRPGLIATVLFLALCPLLGSPAAKQWALGIDALARLDRLPAYKDSIEVGCVSSYDRTGGNDDGFSGRFSVLRRDERGLVIADLKGPGFVYRIWTPTPSDDPVAFYFDGEKKPRLRIPFRQIFLGKREPFVRPLVGYGAGGFYSYVPLGFRKSLTIVVEGKRVQFFQINYARYSAEAPVRTFTSRLSPRELEARKKVIELLNAAGRDISRFCVPPGAASRKIPFRCTIRPGESKVFFRSPQPGRIVGLRVGPSAQLAGKDRALVFRAYWDGERRPAILVPAGDFFGYAWGEPAMRSLLAGTSGGVSYCYFPMPFEREAKLEFYLERKTGPSVTLRGEVLFCAVPRKPDEGRFYALWRRENPTSEGKPFTFVDIKGRGHLVGCVQQSQGESGNTYFFEGDDITYIDGVMAIHGTGSEDFYNGGWYDVPGRWDRRRSFPLSGCLAYKKHLGRTGGYRLMIGDAYAFRKRIVHTIEHAPVGNKLLNDYCGVTYLYLERSPSPPFEIPPLAKRRVSDPEVVVFNPWWNERIYAFTFDRAQLVRIGEKLNGKDVRFLSLQARERDWFGQPFIAFLCEIPERGTYEISIEAAQGPEQGIVQLFADEAPVGRAVDLWAEKRALSGPRRLATLLLEEGPNVLLFKIIGSKAKEGVRRLDLRRIICRRVRR